jgi:colicin import membrane protein
MKERTYVHANPLGQDTDSRTMVLYFGISLLLHIIFIGSMVFWPESAPRSKFKPGAINVSLVSLPGPPAAAPAPAQKPAPQPAPKAVAVPKKEEKPPPKAAVIEPPPPKPKPVPIEKKPEKKVSLAPPEKKIKAKKSLKKKTQDREKMIKQAVSGVEKKVEKSTSDSVKQALDRLKKKVAQTEASGARTSSAAKTTTGVAGGGQPGATGIGGQRTLELIDLYKIEVAFQVERRWAFSQQLAGGNRNLEAKLVFKVMPSGEITDIRFTAKSGNSYLDESAYRAVVKANPVSPHPDGLRTPYVTVPLRFTPEGIRK